MVVDSGRAAVAERLSVMGQSQVSGARRAHLVADHSSEAHHGGKGATREGKDVGGAEAGARGGRKKLKVLV